MAIVKEDPAKGTLIPDEFKFFNQASTNKRGIPEAIFIENVEKVCEKMDPNEVCNKLQELYSKYQYMQSSLTSQRTALKQKVPDIVQALDCVNHLVDRRDKSPAGETQAYTYQMSENIWSSANVAPTNAVCLWLGANVMLEYTLDEAVDLLSTNQKNAKETLGNLDEDMAFLRDQLTTTEVNIARTHNYNVKLRQITRDAEEKGEQKALPAPSSAPAAAGPKPTGESGGSGEGYTWKQEKEEVEISVTVPKGAKKEDVKVTFLAESLKVEHNGKVIVEGELGGRCSPSGSTWTMNNGKVEITMEKGDATKWPSLFVVEA